MCANEPYQYVANGELYQHHQPIIVALDIENISLVAHAIHAVERLPHVGKAFPFRFLGLFVPVLQRSL